MGKEKSSKKLLGIASKVLKDDRYSDEAKSLAGSVLSQGDKNKDSSKKLSQIASEILKDKNVSENTKSLAGSVLTQKK